MALIQMNYNSKALFRTVPVNVILPADRFDSDTDTYTEDKNCKYKTLYLLHGLLGRKLYRLGKLYPYPQVGGRKKSRGGDAFRRQFLLL